MSGGQSLQDRLTAARHALAGQGLARSVCKASTEELIAPKKKHLDCLLQCTNEPNVSIPQMANFLIERTHHSSWVVVFKVLVTIHHLMCYGNERFLRFFASSNYTFQLGNFIDKSGAQGYEMSTFIRRYSKYLSQKAVAYRSVGFDFCKILKGKEDGKLRSMSMENLLQTMPALQNQVNTLVEFDCTSNDLMNSVIRACFMLLFRDLIRLFACYNDGIINLLGNYFHLNKKHCQEGLDMYKKFLIHMNRVAEFLKVAEDIGIDKGDIPDLTKAPSSLLESLEQHLLSLEEKKSSTTTAGPTGLSSNLQKAISTLLSNSNAFGSIDGAPNQEVNGVKKSEWIPEDDNEDASHIDQKKEDSPVHWEQPQWTNLDIKFKEITNNERKTSTSSTPTLYTKTNPFLSSPSSQTPSTVLPVTSATEEVDFFSQSTIGGSVSKSSPTKISNSFQRFNANPFADSLISGSEDRQTLPFGDLRTNDIFENPSSSGHFVTDSSFASAFGEKTASFVIRPEQQKGDCELKMEPSGVRSSVTDQIGETGTKPVPSCLPESVLSKQVECETSENLVWGSSSQDSDPLCSDVNPFKTAFNPLFLSSVSVTASSKYEDKIDFFNDTECKVEETVAQLPPVMKTKSPVHVVPTLKCSDSLSTDFASDPKNWLTFNALQTSDMHQHLLNSAVFNDLNASFEHKHFEDSFMDFEEQAQIALTIKSNSITKNQPIQSVSPIELAPVTILPIGQTSVAGSPSSPRDLPIGQTSVAGSPPSPRNLPMGPSSVAGSPPSPRNLPMGPSPVAGSPPSPHDLPMGPSPVAGSPPSPHDLPMGPSPVAGSPQTPCDLPLEQCSVTGTSSTLTMLRLGESHVTKSLTSEKLLPIGAIPAAGKVPSEAVIEDNSSLLFFEPSGIVNFHSSELYCPSLGMSVSALPVSRKELSSSGAFDLFGEILQPQTLSDRSKSLTTGTQKKQSPVKPLVEGDLESSLANLAQNLDIGVPTQHIKKFEAHQWGPTKSTVKSNAGTMNDGGRWVGSSAVPSGNASLVSSQAGYQPMGIAGHLGRGTTVSGSFSQPGVAQQNMALGVGMDIGMSMRGRGTQPMGVFGRMQPNSLQPSVAGPVDPFGDL